MTRYIFKEIVNSDNDCDYDDYDRKEIVDDSK